MSTAIGVVMTEHIVAGVLVDQKPTGKSLRYPDARDEAESLASLPGSDLIQVLVEKVTALTSSVNTPVDAIGVAVPGVIRHGVVEDSPNLTQIKGMRLADELSEALKAKNISAPVYIANDADAIAAGVAATRGQL